MKNLHAVSGKGEAPRSMGPQRFHNFSRDTISAYEVNDIVEVVIQLRYHHPVKFNLLLLLAQMRKYSGLVAGAILLLILLGGALAAASPDPLFIPKLLIGLIIGLLIGVWLYIHRR